MMGSLIPVRARCALLAAAFLGGLGLSAIAVQAQGNTATVAASVDELSLQPGRHLLVPREVSTVTPAPEDFDKVQLVPGTLLSMNVYGIDELSALPLRVDGEGDVSVPMLGPVHVGGLTVAEAQKALAKALVSGEILVDPIVRLSVSQYAAGYVSVLGEVQSPGRFQVIAPRSLSDVLALAGGETLAAGGDIELQHTNADGSVESQHIHYAQRDPLTNLRNVLVHPGDSIFIRRAGVVYVLGAVNKPGGYLMVDGGGLSVYQALSLAGGTTLDAAKNGLYIIRPHGEGYEEVKVPLSKLVREKQSEASLQVNDVLYIPRSGWKVTFLDGSAIIGAAVNGAIYSAR